MVWLQSRSFVVYEAPFNHYNSQGYCDSEEKYMLGSYLWIKYNCLLILNTWNYLTVKWLQTND